MAEVAGVYLKQGRPSISRNRRSGRGQLYLDKEEEFCEFIPKDLSEEQRLKTLVQICVKHALETTFNDVDDNANIPDKESIVASMTSFVDIQQKEGLYGNAVIQEKSKSQQSQVDDDFEENIKSAERYISKLKNESREWEFQLGRYENEEVSMERDLEKLRCPDKKVAVTLEPEKCNVKDDSYEERMKLINTLYEKFHDQAKILNRTATIVNEFHKKVENTLLEEGRKLDSTFAKLQSLPLHILLGGICKDDECADIKLKE